MAILGLCLGSVADPQTSPQPQLKQKVNEHTRQKPVRKPLPADLPRVHIGIRCTSPVLPG